MKIEADVNVRLSPDSAIERALTSVLNSLEFIKNQGVSIMSVLSDYVAKADAFYQTISDDLDAIQAGIAALNATITTLQNSAGAVTAADQASIDQAQAQLAALTAKADAAAGKTPPTPPAGP